MPTTNTRPLGQRAHFQNGHQHAVDVRDGKKIHAENRELHDAGLPRNHRSHCLSCYKPFSLLRRKIKCASCCEGFCKECTDLWRTNATTKQRICHYCFDSLYKQSMNADCHLPSPTTQSMPILESEDLASSVDTFYKSYYENLRKQASSLRLNDTQLSTEEDFDTALSPAE
ncbi:unnamed protein product [Aphanomyces euteiches]|uniref:FYVE-type domain-containing protein n=1 Tax=Aphanomyces euteiches TaxID=100861 RepID=A0A6G0WE86_9STRA|nr:hypothetical protein Ae201684_015898 [Aphanomyces euteiches]KAH9080171.1 hypothetical protein Ae201684P_009117 [Aphanomyces euteiches]